MRAQSQSRNIRGIYLILLLFLFYQSTVAAEKIFYPGEIKQRLRIHVGQVIDDSDSLLLNSRKLTKDLDYKIDYLNGVVFINTFYQPTDTLIVCFTPLPTWLKKYYGIIPNESGPTTQRLRPSTGKSLYREESKRPSEIVIRGAKKFSVLTQTGGVSKFNQSLDLTIKGEISPGLEISGSVADRGYDPEYGTINSRISELDKLNLRIQSRKFYSEVGNLEIIQKSDYGTANVKQVGGIQAALYSRNFSASGLLAQPRGRFKTVKITGIDKTQGPYRVTIENQSVAIVPGSEKVWLDGRQLQRGADKDYIMDYPAGGVTFTQRILIDSRSRIEIDFEPLTTDYQQEIYQFTSELNTSDSNAWIRVDFTRETDDKNRLKTGQLGSDDIGLLRTIGDSVQLNLRDGAVPDSSGNYIELYDTLGQRYFEYVGDSLGDYSVSFSTVGFGNGDYIYNGSDIYKYVGRGKGDYAPYVRIPVPSREDYYESEFGVHPGANSTIKMIVRQSDYDRNLFSELNDNNNLGGQYIFAANAGQTPSIYSDKYGFSATAEILNKNFKPRQRRDRPDLSRKFLIPVSLSPSGNQKEAGIASALPVPGPYNVLLNSGYLDYEKQFNSYYGTVVAYPGKNNSPLPVLSLTQLKSQLDSTGVKGDGRNEIFSADIDYQFHNQVTISSSFKFDRRWNQYQIMTNGTTERIYDVNMKYRILRVELQHNNEDTLVTTWQRRTKRDRAAFGIKSQTGAVKTDLYLVGQRLAQYGTKEDQFMVRLNMAYLPTAYNLSVNGSYTLSDENRNERGVRYIEVEPGQGKFIYENGQYVPDVNGNYIEIEEIHSDQASVKKGEKSFNLTYYPAGFYLKLIANISEDLLAGQNRNAWWVLPFYSDEKKAYFYRKLYYSGELKFIEIPGSYFINLAGSYNYEERQLGGQNPDRYERQFRIKFNEAYRSSRFGQEAILFEYHRDSYFSSPGNIDGFEVTLSNSTSSGRGQIFGSLAFRFAKDTDFSRSKLVSLVLQPRIRFAEGGETSLKLEPYFQELKAAGTVSYRLTDDHYGTRGIRWTLRSDYKLRQNLKISVSFDGRHSDDRKPRIVGRGELVANF